MKNPRKGLANILDVLENDVRFQDVLFLQMGKESNETTNFDPVRFPNFLSLGFIADEAEKADIYRGVDATLVPTLQESLSVVASDSICQGTPVVAFATSGLTSYLKHGVTGYLAKPFDARELLDGLDQILDPADSSTMPEACLQVAQETFEPMTVVSQMEGAIAEAKRLFGSLGAYPSELEVLEGILGTVTEDNRFRHMHRRSLVKRHSAQLESQAQQLAQLETKLKHDRNRLAWNRKKVNELKTEIEDLRACKATLLKANKHPQNNELQAKLKHAEDKLAWNRKKVARLTAEVEQLRAAGEAKSAFLRPSSREDSAQIILNE